MATSMATIQQQQSQQLYVMQKKTTLPATPSATYQHQDCINVKAVLGVFLLEISTVICHAKIGKTSGFEMVYPKMLKIPK